MTSLTAPQENSGGVIEKAHSCLIVAIQWSQLIDVYVIQGKGAAPDDMQDDE